LPPLISLLLVTCMLWSALIMPLQAAPPPPLSGDDNLAFLLELNGTSAYYSNSSYPIPVDLSTNLTIELSIDVGAALRLWSGLFVMKYLAIPIVNQPFNFSGVTLPAGWEQVLVNTSFLLLGGYGGLNLITGTVEGVFSFTYELDSAPGTNVTVSEDFVLRLGPVGPAALLSVAGLITLGFTVTSVFGLLLSLDEFQQGIMAARKMRGAKKASDVGIFPRAVVLRRHPKKDGERISKEELVRRVSEAARGGWDGKRCPKCGKKWAPETTSCPKCKLDRQSAVTYFSQDIAEYGPKALNVVKPKSKVPVGRFSRRLRLKPDKGGALAAALTDMGVFQTRSVKIPLMKVALAGMTLSGTYLSWMQIIGGAIPSWLDVLLFTCAGLVISVLVAYFMKWLARIPKLGYD